MIYPFPPSLQYPRSLFPFPSFSLYHVFYLTLFTPSSYTSIIYVTNSGPIVDQSPYSKKYITPFFTDQYIHSLLNFHNNIYMLSSLCAVPETVYKSTRWTLHGVECISHKNSCKRFLVSFDTHSSVTQHWSCLTVVSSARRFHSGAFPELRTKSHDVCRDVRENTSQTDIAYHLFRNLFNDAASATETLGETWYERGV